MPNPLETQEPSPTAADTAVELSIVIPVKDEAMNIAPLVEEIFAVRGLKDRLMEILFVDDGSRDGTLTEIKAAAGRHPAGAVRWLSFDRNHGQTAAFDAGFRAARGKWIATMDGDLQNDPADLPMMLERLKDADMVAGYRKRRRDGPMRRISSRIGNAIRNWATGEAIIDTGCSLKVMRRRCLSSMKLYEGLHRFFPTLLRMEGFTVTEVPVHHRPRLKGRAKYGVWNRLFRSSMS